MKTTLEIPDDLLADATTFAAREGRVLNDMGSRVCGASSPRFLRGRVWLPIIECGAPGRLTIPPWAEGLNALCVRGFLSLGEIALNISKYS